MKKTFVLKKFATVAAAVLMAAPVCTSALSAVVSADTTGAPAQAQQTNTTAAKIAQAPSSAKKVKTFKVAVVKKNYGIYQGAFENKQPGKKYFHQAFNVNHTFTHNGKTYYWINKKGKKAIGYINKKAVARPNQSKLVDAPYVSQYVPVKTPWGCAGASMAMLLGAQGQKITTGLLKKIQDNLPMQPTKGGQKGNVYTGVGFGYVISPGALAKYARTFKKGKKVINVSGKKLTVNDMKMYVQAGKPVLYYGFSSYQKPGDYVRNHCKVITGYKKGKFLVYDPLYYSKFDKAGTGGKNMAYDHGAIAWVPKSAIQNEFCHKALTIK